jgi:hypothetical protein
VRVRNHDQLGGGCQGGAHHIRIKGEALLPAALEPHHVRAGRTRGGDQRIVTRRLDQHVVPRLDQGEHHLEVRARGAIRGGDLLDRHPIAARDRVTKRDEAFVARPGNIEGVFRGNPAEHFLGAHRQEPARGQIVGDRLAGLRPS